MGYTHVELLPVMEHPFDGSWGYQTVGYFAPTSRFGAPEDFMEFVDRLHQAGIGVLLDWAPAHFPRDAHGLAEFDGTHLYEHADPRQGEHPDWGTLVFNYGRNEVQNFLIANALFWFEKYHVDGLRVDAVASMLYLDYSRRPGEWIPNQYGGRENLGAIAMLKRLSEVVHEKFPGVLTIAEESTAWPAVSRPVYLGGLGFDLKWNMGWMNDTLKYFSLDPVFRKFHHNRMTFSMLYAFTENFVLPISHDEVVHGKASLLNKMPGDLWQQFANLRLLFGYMYGHPGKKMLFMGCEFGQREEWTETRSLEWNLLEYPQHRGVQRLVTDLNALLKREPALHEVDFQWKGFEWLDCNDADASVLSFERRARDPQRRRGRRREFHARRSRELSRRRARARPLSRNHEHRRRNLQRHQHRQSRRRECRSGALERSSLSRCASAFLPWRWSSSSLAADLPGCPSLVFCSFIPAKSSERGIFPIATHLLPPDRMSSAKFQSAAESSGAPFLRASRRLRTSLAACSAVQWPRKTPSRKYLSSCSVTSEAPA